VSDVESLKRIVDKILDICEHEKIQQSEVYIERRTVAQVNKSPQQKVRQIQTSTGTAIGLSLRILLEENQMGITFSSELDEESLEDLVLKAKKSVLPIKDFKGFIPACEPTAVDGIYDPRIVEITHDSTLLFKMIKETQQKTTEHPKVNLEHTAVTAAKLDRIIANSNGLNQKDEGTFLSFSLQTALEDQEEQTRTFRHQVKRNISDLSIEAITNETIKETKIMSKPVTLVDGDYPTIITARAASDLYGYQFDANICLSGATSGTSKLGDRMAEKVASEKLTLYDDGTLPGGQYTTPFDDEGAATEKTIIIKDGILEGFLSNYYHATKNNSKTTGNCVKLADRRINNYYTRAYNYRPLTSPTNFCVAPGDCSEEELLEETGDGLLINLFTGGISITDPSGDFNIPALHIYKIEDGEIKGGIQQASVAGNWYNIFADIQLIGKKRESEMSSLGVNSYVWPKLLVKSLSFKNM
jgi:PmbA protein